jgi:GDP-4-dehydro-6-deoxy-D-mannose reductase
MNRVLITGAAGFIGRHLKQALRRTGTRTIAGLDLREPAEQDFDRWFTTDLTSYASTVAAVRSARPDMVFHLAGLFRGTDAEVIASNLETGVNLLQALREEAPATRLVLLGSAAEYGAVPLQHQPVVETHAGTSTGTYGSAKQKLTAAAIDAFTRFGQHVGVARPFNVLGPGTPESLVTGAIVRRLRQALKAPPPRRIVIGRTTGIRDFVAAEDVAEGLIRVGESGKAGECYNLCSGTGHSISELLEILLTEAGGEVEVVSDQELLRAGDVDQLIGDPGKAERELGWRARIGFHQSVVATWQAAAG